MQRRSSATKLVRRSLTVLGVALLAFLAPVSAASAHDALIGSSPEDGQTVEDMPDVIELTFSNVPLAVGSQVTVEDADGTDWAVGEIEIVNNTVNQPISPEAPSGEYTVTWRVVSSDGHPIDGTFEFTANTGGEGDTSALPPTTADSQPAPDDPEESEAAADASNTFPTGPVVGIVAALIVLGIIIAMFTRRRSKHNGSA